MAGWTAGLCSQLSICTISISCALLIDFLQPNKHCSPTIDFMYRVLTNFLPKPAQPFPGYKWTLNINKRRYFEWRDFHFFFLSLQNGSSPKTNSNALAIFLQASYKHNQFLKSVQSFQISVWPSCIHFTKDSYFIKLLKTNASKFHRYFLHCNLYKGDLHAPWRYSLVAEHLVMVKKSEVTFQVPGWWCSLLHTDLKRILLKIRARK